MGTMVHLNNKVFYACQQTLFRVFSKHQRIEKGTRSAYLFVLAMEALSCHLEKAREGSLLLGFGVEGGVSFVVRIETLVFCETLIAK